MRPLILVGGNGHCKSIMEAAESKGLVIGGILDLPENVGEQVLNYPAIGTDSDTPRLVSDFDFIVTLGFIKTPFLRIRPHERIEATGGGFVTIIASIARVSQYVIAQYGTAILHHVCVNTGASIGEGCIIDTSVNIKHGALIGDYCYISIGTMINGDCYIGKHTSLGNRPVIVNDTEIVAGYVIAAGAVIHKNILHKGIYSGNPAPLKVRL